MQDQRYDPHPVGGKSQAGNAGQEQQPAHLHAYLNTVNSKNNFKDTIWYAIFPNLSISLQAGAKLRRERFAGNVHKVNEDVNSLETLSTLLDVLKDYRWRPSSPSRPGRRPLSMRWRPRESRSSSTL